MYNDVVCMQLGDAGFKGAQCWIRLMVIPAPRAYNTAVQRLPRFNMDDPPTSPRPPGAEGCGM
jgi:hypothetical protein